MREELQEPKSITTSLGIFKSSKGFLVTGAMRIWPSSIVLKELGRRKSTSKSSENGPWLVVRTPQSTLQGEIAKWPSPHPARYPSISLSESNPVPPDAATETEVVHSLQTSSLHQLAAFKGSHTQSKSNVVSRPNPEGTFFTLDPKSLLLIE